MANKKTETSEDRYGELNALVELQQQIITSLTDTIVKLSQVIADATEPDDDEEKDDEKST